MKTGRGSRTAMAALAAAVFMVQAGAALAMDVNGFLREKDHGDVALSFTAESYDHFWAGSTRVSAPPLGTVRTRSLSLWADYGITDRLTVSANLPYIKASGSGSAQLEEKDLQDLSVLGRYRVAAFGSALRHEFVAGLGIRTIASNYEANSAVDVGDGTSDFLMRVVYQLTYGRYYLSQQVGFDLRSGDAPNGFPLYTEVGATCGPVSFAALYQRLEARGGTDIGDPGFTFPSNKEEYERVGGKAFWRLGPTFGLSAMAWTTLDGRNTGDTTGGSLGVNVRY